MDNRSSDNFSRSRRRFLKQSLMGIGAASLFPSTLFGHAQSQTPYYYEQWQQMEELPDDRKLNIALVGLGGYASGQLAPALQKTKLCKLNGIVTGTPAKEDRWARRYNIPEKNIYNYETYDRIADNDDIDIIYIVLPNGLHAEYTIRAAEAGKHVISEKPMATSVADAEAMIEACRKAGKKLSIGYRLHFEPHHEKVMRLGQHRELGKVQSMEGGHGFRIGGDPDRWRMDKELSGGGPLMDVGIYAVQAAIYTLGEVPESVTAETITNNEKLFDEVEETIKWELKFSGGVTAKGESSYGYGANYHNVNASDGWAKLSPAYSYSGIEGKTSNGPMNYPFIKQQTMQMDAFADCILNDRQSRVPGEMGLRDMKILMAIYEAAETGERQTFDWPDDVAIQKM